MATFTVKASNVRETMSDVEGGVDVSVLVTIPGEGECRGDVTLLPAQDGRPVYESWGEPGMWVSTRLLGWLRAAQWRADGSSVPTKEMLGDVEAAASELAGRPS